MSEEKKEHFVGRLVFELLIVFAGVYGAFVVSDFQDQQRAKRARIAFLQTFREDLVRMDRQMVIPRMQVLDSLIVFYESAMAAGKKPELKFHPTIDFTSTMLVVRAAFNSDYLENIEREHIVSISQGSNLITLIEKKSDVFQNECRRWFHGPSYTNDDFYDRSGRLKPGMQWYLDDMKELRHLLQILDIAIMQGAVKSTDHLLKKEME